jgi:hypothetical protein
MYSEKPFHGFCYIPTWETFIKSCRAIQITLGDKNNFIFVTHIKIGG